MANISKIKVGDTSYGITATPTAHDSTATTYGAASASNYGHVKLSDNYTSSAGAAASGIGASSAAVYNAYNTLNSNLNTITTNLGYTPDYIYVANANWTRKTSILLTNENSTNVKENNGFLITFGFATGTGDCCVQINTPFSGNPVHIRTCWHTQWRDWITFNPIS